MKSNEEVLVLKGQLETAVLFLVFNRLETTRIVFETIKQAKPTKLYIASDGPRASRQGEAEKVETVRSYILENITWPCEVKTLFRSSNLGCGKAVSGAITWFFENEEMGIILEDDCLPSLSFFRFCEVLLEKYKDDPRVMQINGSAFIQDLPGKPSYSFSKYSHIWGWASWRRAWDHYQFTRDNFETDFNRIEFTSRVESKYWFSIFKEYFAGRIDTWDYPWIFTMMLERGLAIYPHKNMIENIGFGPDATHTTDLDSKLAKLKKFEMEQLYHPKSVQISEKLDKKNFRAVFQAPLWKRIINCLKNSR